MKLQLSTVVPAFFRARLFLCGLTCALILAGDGWAASHSVVKEASYSGEYGLQLDFDTTGASYLQDESPVSEPHYRARFYINLSQLNFGEEDQFDLFTGYRDKNLNGPDDTDRVEFKLLVEEVSGDRLLTAKAYNGDGGEIATNGIVIADGWHSVEVEWQAWASNVNGYLNLWLDGEPQEGITGLFYQGAVIDFVRWGVVTGNPATITGYMDLDDFASARFDYIGVNVRAAGCSGDEVTLDISKFPLPEDIPVLCQASRSFKTTDKQSVVVAKGMNLRIESPRTTLYPGLQVQVDGIFSVGR